MVGGLDRSMYPTAGMVPSPIQPGVAGLDLGGDLFPFCSVDVGVEPKSLELSLSFPCDSFRLSCKACRRSTRSRHCASSCRMDSDRAFSVSVLGVKLDGTR